MSTVCRRNASHSPLLSLLHDWNRKCFRAPLFDRCENKLWNATGCQRYRQHTGSLIRHAYYRFILKNNRWKTAWHPVAVQIYLRQLVYKRVSIAKKTVISIGKSNLVLPITVTFVPFFHRILFYISSLAELHQTNIRMSPRVCWIFKNYHASISPLLPFPKESKQSVERGREEKD